MAAEVEITGIEERIKQLGEASTKNPMMQKRINEVIRKVLLRAQKALRAQAQTGLKIKNDPREAYKAVRMAVYRRIFGGQVNILSPRNAKLGRLYEPPKKQRSGKRGGNRVRRTQRTTELMSYMGADRGFILRFLNQGTGDRAIHSMGGQELRTGSVSILRTKSLGGNRGQIDARNWFGNASQAQLEMAAEDIDRMIDDIIKGILY